MAGSFYESESKEAITCIEDLLNVSRNIRRPGPGVNPADFSPPYWRGHGDRTWKLTPTIGRNQTFAGKACNLLNEEDRLLNRFRRYASKFIGHVPDEWEALFLARHHGLPVRLLDWSSNPLVALYNACRELENKAGAVFAIIRKPNESAFINIMEKDPPPPLDVPGLRMVYPIHASPRIVAQAGFFTIQANPAIPLEKHERDSPKAEEFDFVQLMKWRIPSENKQSMLEELSYLGVNRQTLYPDLDGLAMGLWHTVVLRSGKTSGACTNCDGSGICPECGGSGCGPPFS